MNNDLPCSVVRDLLPSYLENLTEETTNQAVQKHLESCESCRRHYADMSNGVEMTRSEVKEVDYLKKIRKKNLAKVCLFMALAVVLVLGGVGIKLFVIGSPVKGDFIVSRVIPSQTENNILVQFSNLDSASRLVDLRLQSVNDTVSVTGRKVLLFPFQQPEKIPDIKIETAGVSTVEAFGKVIWENGVVVDYHTDRLMGKKTPYVGNASAVDQLISNMDLDSPHTLELQTKQEPYGVTIHFTDPIEEKRRFIVEGNAYILLALVENLGEVYWDDAGGYAGSLTLEQANAALPDLVNRYNHTHGTKLVPLEGIKDYSASSYHLQLLRNMLEI